MTDLRRSLLWGVFLVSLFLLYDAWNKHNGQPSMFGPRPVAQHSAPGASGVAGVPGAVPSSTAAPSGAATAAVVPAETVTVETDLVRATLVSTGGRLIRLELLQQKDHPEKGLFDGFIELFSKSKTPPPAANVVLFDQSAQRVYIAESGLINVPNPVTHLSPMRVLPGERSLKAGANDLTVAFESSEGGVKLIKTYAFHRGSYAIDVKHEVINDTASAIATPQIYLQLKRDGQAGPGGSSFYSTFTGPAIYTEAGKYHKVDFSDIDKGKVAFERADDGWVAMVQHYFATAWLHNAPQSREFLVTRSSPEEDVLGHRVYSVSMRFTLPKLDAGAKQSFDAVLFAGPQEESRLEVLAPGLERVKDYGLLTILSKPLFWLLTQLHGLIGNWGWSIVALVVLLKIAFFYLNSSAYRSMAKMKAVGPKITEMRERLKDKPQQMQQEMMRIYKEEKVNPVGGCLPIFIQMPFFIALYWVLLSSVEMRQAPWIGWITDLSAKDPYFILPLLMMGTSVLTSFLQPPPPDPMQAKMMRIMPVIFSIMFFAFPAGLVLYWLTNNILSIAQQYLINRQMGVKSV